MADTVGIVASDSGQTPRKNIFDLPLELREQIYENVLPADRNFSIVRHHYISEETDMCSLLCTSRRVSEEARQVIKRVCDARIILTPSCELEKSLLLDALEKARSMEIYVDYGELPMKDTENESDEEVDGWDIEEAIVEQLRKAAEELSEILRRYSRLPSLTIRFKEEPMLHTGDGLCSDPFWTGKVEIQRKNAPEISMAFIKPYAKCHLAPRKIRKCYLGYILPGFRDLPTCENARIIRLEGVADSDEPIEGFDFEDEFDVFMKSKHADYKIRADVYSDIYDAFDMDEMFEKYEKMLTRGPRRRKAKKPISGV